jgi:uncharacterized protein (TIGR03083 family)
MAIHAGTRLDASVRIDVLDPLRAANSALLDLLGSFAPDDWNSTTVHADRSVKDLTAHLLHGSIRRVTWLRDGYRPPARTRFETADELTRWIQEENRAFMKGMSGVSPQVICELIGRYDPELVRLFERLDPDALGLGVVWAGEWQSQNWFDIAREYTEKWHHQQQLRDATGRPSLYDPSLFTPALEVFARGLPFAYRELREASGTRISVFVEGPVSLAWTLLKEEERWSLWSGAEVTPDTSIFVSADVLWRMWTKEIAPAAARYRLRTVGNDAHTEPLVRFVAIMA